MLPISGVFHVKHIRGGRQLLDLVINNNVCDAAKNDLLNAYFKGSTRHTTWYLGVIDATNFVAVDAADTAAVHSGWQECLSYSYDIAGLRSYLNRPKWQVSAPASQTILGSSRFDFTADCSIEGLFVQSSQPKSDTTGILWSSAMFAVAAEIAAGDSLQVFYQVKL